MRRAFERLARRLGVEAVRAAHGVLDVARAAMRRALGVMTMQRGHDPRALPLVAFGGAGGLHAAALAASLDMRGGARAARAGRAVGVGMATADAIRDLSETVLAPLGTVPAAERRRRLAALAAEGRRELRESGFRAREVAIEPALALRYEGQSYEIDLPAGAGDPAQAFHRRHEELYGYRLPDAAIELVHLRVRAVVRRPVPRPRPVRLRPLPAAAVIGRRRAHFASTSGAARAVDAPVIDRARLAPGHRFEGPALVEEFSGTTLVPPGWRARVTSGGHLLLERR